MTKERNDIQEIESVTISIDAHNATIVTQPLTSLPDIRSETLSFSSEDVEYPRADTMEAPQNSSFSWSSFS
jgi:hypothetical protein